MGINTFDHSNNDAIVINFSQKYGMLIKRSDKEVIDSILSQWAIQENYHVETNTPFSKGLQLKMAEAMRAKGIVPIRSITGVFTSLKNNILRYKINNGSQQETDQIVLTLTDGLEKYDIALDRQSDIAALLAIGCIDSKLKLGETYEFALYNKEDENAHKKSHVFIKDKNGQTIRSSNPVNFNAYVNAIKQARLNGKSFADSQYLNPNSRDYKEVVSKTILRQRSAFIANLVERANLSGSPTPSIGDIDDEFFDDRIDVHSQKPVRQQVQPHQSISVDSYYDEYADQYSRSQNVNSQRIKPVQNDQYSNERNFQNNSPQRRDFQNNQPVQGDYYSREIPF